VADALYKKDTCMHAINIPPSLNIVTDALYKKNACMQYSTICLDSFRRGDIYNTR
jgi:hypothetical protein